MAGVIEFRVYQIQPGRRAEIMDVLRSRLFPANRKLGMRVLGPFPSAEDEDTLVWLRAFPDAASRETMTKAFYGGQLWREELQDAIVPAMTGHNVTVVEDIAGLWDRWPEALPGSRREADREQILGSGPDGV
jgi:hypothetical protein